MNINSEDLENYETENALTQMKNNKAPGPDGILAELLKEGTYQMIEILKTLFIGRCSRNMENK